MNRLARIGAFVALLLGAVGILLAAAVAIGAIVFAMQASSAVDDVTARIEEPVDRLEVRIAETSAAVEEAEGAELSARIDGLVDGAEGAQASIDAITEHPLYAQLPVDTSKLETSLEELSATAESLREVADDASAIIGGQAANRVQRRLDEANAQIADVDARIVTVADSLKFWIRVSALVFFLLALWGLLGQLLLARYGLRRLRPIGASAALTSNEKMSMRSKSAKKAPTVSSAAKPSLVSLFVGLRSFASDPSAKALTGVTMTLIGLGTVFYRIVESLSWLDSLYLAIITLTTVGYGDISPQTGGGKAFTMVYVVLGIGVLVAFITSISEHLVAARKPPSEVDI